MSGQWSEGPAPLGTSLLKIHWQTWLLSYISEQTVVAVGLDLLDPRGMGLPGVSCRSNPIIPKVYFGIKLRQL